MPKNLFKEINEVLNHLQASTPDVTASALVRQDGLVVASIVPSGVSERMLAALTAAALGVGNRISREFKQGKLKKVLVDSEKGQLVLMSLKNNILSVLVRPESNLGYVFMQLEKTVKNLEELVEE
ncbi:MAG: roadblock/LC7 domain-containing protein [Candidatus Odinarchaeota archaeon]|nr:roadblock/LC7 domain-containing protein [Candidatus Odinarchaeota archaeon]